jgi:hypothetical protein
MLSPEALKLILCSYQILLSFEKLLVELSNLLGGAFWLFLWRRNWPILLTYTIEREVNKLLHAAVSAEKRQHELILCLEHPYVFLSHQESVHWDTNRGCLDCRDLILFCKKFIPKPNLHWQEFPSHLGVLSQRERAICNEALIVVVDIVLPRYVVQISELEDQLSVQPIVGFI